MYWKLPAAFVLALVVSSPTWSAGYGDPCNNERECPISTGRTKAYCYPGPTGGSYCLHGDFNCAIQGRPGVTWGYTHDARDQVCTCVTGQGWSCKRK
ncbi:MAG: hypothetical protein F9K29_23235 [Hyphomicrobiaceae bacterium]|nr:MAG: hypothetical protein F9K29_23235 [Hyphomicrobiaceae bacterium]